MPFLVADSIRKSYRSRQVLSAGTLRAVKGEVRVIFGRNGAGKSTLLKVAAGVVSPDAGHVRLQNEVLMRPSLARMARLGVFYLPDHDLLSPTILLDEQLSYFQKRFGERSVGEAARIARIEPLLTKRPRTFSGGELRRAELAAVLTRRPACLLADEPYRGIAPVDHDALSEIFLQMAADGCAVVITGHDVPSLLALAHHITWCTSGTTYELGPPAAARDHELFRRDYLGPMR